MSRFEKLGKALNEIHERYVQRILFDLTAIVYLLLGGGIAEKIAQTFPILGIILALPAVIVATSLLLLTLALTLILEPIFDFIEHL